jgi:LysM repeat protein
MSEKLKFWQVFLVFCLLFLFLKEEGKEKFNFGDFPKKDSIFQEYTNSNFYYQPLFSQNFLFPALPPQSLTSKVYASIEENKKEIIFEYTVENGDTLDSISKKFNISKETLILANNLDEKTKLKVGQKLIVLPKNGVLHLVEKGETLEKIAKKYNAKVEDILAFNEIEDKNVYENDIIFVPCEKLPKKPKKISQKILAQNYFICPLSKCQISQGLHFFNAVDFRANCSEPVFASAGGKVEKVGFSPLAGNFVKISHPDGISTLYYHLEKILVSKGENVSQGDLIGRVGATGLATGCHLHFEVRGAKNPFAF